MYQIVNTANNNFAWDEVEDCWLPAYQATIFSSVDEANDVAEMTEGIPGNDYIIVRCI